jgi:pantoate--beta-alanine ligase
MGALHEGHGSLIRRAAAENDVVIVTVFVNPLQFGPREDFARYPRMLSRDLTLARAAGADIVFAPSLSELYPPGFQTAVRVGSLAARWEGQARPGHFDGVATVVTLLFNVTRPSHAYFGQKDYQQVLVVKQLARDVRLPLTVHMLPTVREPDGLAMSSRNTSLTPSQRAQATVLYRALRAARARIRSGERRAGPLLQQMRRLIHRARDARVDYAAIVDAGTLAPQARLRGRVAILLAVWIGRTRLIDNFLVDVS